MTATATFPEWQHRFCASKPCDLEDRGSYGNKAIVSVNAGLHYIRGNARPYFSVTGDIRIPGRRDIETGGCMHETLLKYWPELAPVVALHLSDDTGEPMHAEANGWYWLEGYYGQNTIRLYDIPKHYHGGNGSSARSREECLRIFAEHARVDLEQARTLADTWRAEIQRRMIAGDLETGVTLRSVWRAWLREQGERFRAETAAAIALLDKLAAMQGEK